MLQLRVALTAFLVGLFMVLNPSSAFAEVVFANVVCADNRGEQQSFAIGWDNTNTFFDGKGDIARFFCEGGHARQYNVYVSDDLALDDPRRYYNGILPTPTVSPEPTPEPVVPTPVVTETPQPEPVSSPVQSESPTPIQTPAEELAPSSSPTPVVEPPVVPSVEPTVEAVAPIEATPEAIALPEPSPTLSASPEPSVEPAPIVEPINEQVVVLEVPSVLANIEAVKVLFEAAEAFMNIGSDMTPEQREESQKVVVSAIIATQLAMPRRMK